MGTSNSRSRLCFALGCWLVACCALLPVQIARAGPALAAVEEEFREAVQQVAPATVVCVPRGVTHGTAGFSSGVLLTPDGLVLSDGDAGLYERVEGGRRIRRWSSDVEVRVRVPKPARAGNNAGSYRAYRARVLRRDRSADTTLLEIVETPTSPLPHVTLGSSDALRVGAFTFAFGTAFDKGGRTPPTVTAGIVAAIDAGQGEGRPEPGGWFYVTSGVNRGVNGGPVIDISGRLVGTIGTWVEPESDAPYQYLGKVVPIDRIRAVHRGVAEASGVLDAPIATAPPRQARALEQVFSAAAARARPAVVSLLVRRRAPLAGASPFDEDDAVVRRWQGPVSGIVVSPGGLIVTALYNLTNVGTLVEPCWDAAPGAGLDQGLDAILGVTAHFPSGRRLPARLVGTDRRLGVALLEVDLPYDEGRGLQVLEKAPAGAFEAGRFVLAVGNPYGANARDHADPLLSVGILSKLHPDDAAAAWRGQWQTDAGATDANAGGAAVDLEGRLLGMLTLWHPARHGRSSGVGFVVPWSRIEAALPALRRGAGPKPGFLGIRFAPGVLPRIADVIEGEAAARAGLLAGDLVHRVDREEVPTVDDVIAVIGHRCAGDVVNVTVERDGSLRTLPIRLGVREDARGTRRPR